MFAASGVWDEQYATIGIRNEIDSKDWTEIGFDVRVYWYPSAGGVDLICLLYIYTYIFSSDFGLFYETLMLLNQFTESNDGYTMREYPMYRQTKILVLIEIRSWLA